MASSSHRGSAITLLLTGGEGIRPLDLGQRRFLHPGRLRWLRALLWAVGLFVLLALPSYSTAYASLKVLPRGAGVSQFVAQIAAAVVALVIYVAAVKLAEDRTPAELSLRPMAPEIGAGLIIGGAMFAGVMAIMSVSGLYEIVGLGLAPAWVAAGKAIQSGIVEELLMRAVLLRLVWRAAGPSAAFAISAAVFGFGHLGNPNATVFAAICIAFEAGIMLAAFYALTGRIWVSIGVHAGWNFTQGYVFGAAVSGSDFGPALARSTAISGRPEWLTGGAFGPEASLPGLVVCTLVGLAVLWAAARAGQFAKRGAQSVS